VLVRANLRPGDSPDEEIMLRTGTAGFEQFGNDDAICLSSRVVHDDPWLDHDRTASF
jgi:hypothetical protein